jgi:hypothetical protein
MTCNDNSTEYCGGPNRLNVYKLDITVISTTASTSVGRATTTAPQSETETITATTTALDTTTATSPTAVASSSPTPTGPVVNPGQHGYSSIGCYTEATDARALANYVETDDKTVGDCLGACSTYQYVYAGLEYGGECWCGDSLGKGSIPASIEDCSMTCNGNSTEFCGGPNRLNVYKLTRLPMSTTTISSAATSAPSVPTPTGPAIKQHVRDYSFQGCFEEPVDARAIIEQMYADDSMSLEACADFCKGYTYFGTEYGRECYCGNVLNEGSKKAANQDDCSFPCAGNDKELCGAGSRLELYKVQKNATTSSSPSSSATTTPVEGTASKSSAAPTPTPTGPVIWQGNKNFTYYGCLSEPSAGKLMDNQAYNNDTAMTPQMCLLHCSEYKYAGVEYGQECWCGDSLNLAGWEGAVPGKNVTGSECDVVCPGNLTEYCGAGNRLQLYVKRTEFEVR